MKRIALLALMLTATTASAANVAGSQTTPLTLQVNNYCQVSYQHEPNVMTEVKPELSLGTISAIRSSAVEATRVMAVDCNYKTALNISLPESVSLTNGTDTIVITQDEWDSQHPLTMSFDQSGSFNSPYEYYEVKASFMLGGAPYNSNRAWFIPGGKYTGNLVVSYNYDE